MTEDRLRIGYIPLTDAAALIVAVDPDNIAGYLAALRCPLQIS
jgi:hypothetical protein